MERYKIAPSYDSKWLEIERPQPLSDNRIDQLINDVLSGNMNKDISNDIYNQFKKEFIHCIINSSFNRLTGLENFSRIDICSGCTQFIDTIYMKELPQFIIGDYRYHDRLGNYPSQISLLKQGVPLIIAMPFPSIGEVHPHMNDILDECLNKQIPVHIDGAWYSCSRDVEFDCNHMAITSIGISLSKGFGLGWNRVGLRWTRDTKNDAITIMNDFNMINKADILIARHFIKNLEPDYLWKTHGDRYYKICRDFNLNPTKSIHLALKGKSPVGVSPLIRYLEYND